MSHIKASDILTSNPITVSPQTLAVDALTLLKDHDISQLAVTENGIYKGILHYMIW
ncbi:CBS domain-containing protein [Staphylococcus aureus]